MELQTISKEYFENGYTIIPNAISDKHITRLLENYISLVNEISGRHFTDPNGQDLIDFYNKNKETESQIYLNIRDKPWLTEFSLQEEITNHVKQIIGDNCGLFKKIPFRIDVPFWTEELAHWHQDFFYVKGNQNTVTTWIPLQDTTYINGCLSVMPKSHLLGIVEHNLKIGKKFVPGNIFNNEIRMVQMKKGDLLLFSSLLLHSSNLNLSNTIRYSMQSRYTSLNESVNESIEGIIPL